MNAKITISVFILLLGGLTILNLATPSRAQSENENRTLQQMPPLTVSSIITGSFMVDFDTYITDQFVQRDAWVGVKTISEKLLGKKSSGGVYFARDNYLIEMFDSVDLEQYNKNIQYIKNFSNRASDELGITVTTVLVPTASMVLSDKLPAFAPEIDQQKLLDTAAQEIPGFVDVSQALLAHADEYIYYKTDHHWTSLGAFYAYNQWRTEKGLPARESAEFTQQILSDSFWGTTYSKANLYTVPPDTITGMLPVDLGEIVVDYNNAQQISDTIYEYSYLDVKDKYSVFLNANQPLVKITTSVDNGQRLLVVKDSYANTLIQFLLADYQEIHVIDLRYFKTSIFDYVQENNISEALILYNLSGFSSDANLFFLDR